MEGDKPRSINDLLALLGVESYDAAVDEEQFWINVGEELQRRRLRLGMKSTNAVAAHGGPTYKTVSEIEAGRVGQIAALRQYCTAVKMTVVDLFRAVLSADRRQLGPELEEIIRKYERAETAGRTAIHSVALAVKARAPDDETPHGPQGPRPSKPKSPNATPKRRVSR